MQLQHAVHAHLVSIVMVTVATMSMLPARNASAQSTQFEVAAGVARPARGYDGGRAAGPMVRASLKVVGTHGWQLRVDGQGLELRGLAAPTLLAEERGTLRSVGGFLTLAAGPKRFVVQPYVLVSAGIEALSIAGAERRGRSVLGSRLGGGIRVALRRVDLAFEVARHAVWSDYGVTIDYARGAYVPITLALTF